MCESFIFELYECKSIPLVMQPGDDGGDLAALCQLEECVRGVEDAGLQEQHEGHPLVVRLVLNLIPLLASPGGHQAHDFT